VRAVRVVLVVPVDWVTRVAWVAQTEQAPPDEPIKNNRPAQ
jgi:hypothetical protein